MSRELPLLLGSIGAVLGVLAFFPGIFSAVVFLAQNGPTGSNFGTPSVVSSIGFVLIWVGSPCFGLAGAFTVKKRGKTGGILFLTAGLLPWIYGLLVWPDPLFLLLWFFWTPLVLLAGILALLDWPGPYVDPEEKAEMKDANVS
ncbi:MAG TPA: DUF4064 domain-containing protein [Candidatus Bathyarchaeia archaeon]|nr:DUF4064 domain-containing protein [Candidatus Bathyarchaeia archaeon]